jgi:hypothetical protein
MAQQPLLFMADGSGFPVTPAEIICIAILAVAMFVVQDLSMIFLAALLLAAFLFLARWGAKPTLRSDGNCLEYQNGKILSKVKLSDISGATIKGNRFIGRSLVISGNVQVTVGEGKPVQRSSLMVADAFRQSLEDIRSAIAAAAPASSQAPASERP